MILFLACSVDKLHMSINNLKKGKNYMNSQVVSFLDSDNIAVLQLTVGEPDSFKYITAAKAMREQTLQVKEINSSGSVNEIAVFNLSEEFIFIMDGDILQGAKQNRVLNTSVLLRPNSKTILPVSCVERGRWQHTSDEFSSSDYTAPAYIRSRKADNVSFSLKQDRSFRSNQGEVWSDVHMFQDAHRVQSRSSNFSDIHLQKAEEFNKLVSSFQPDASANGVAVFIKGELLGIDIFNRKDVYAEYFPKLLKGAAAEVVRGKKEININRETAEKEVLGFLGGYDNIPAESFPGVAAGNERRFKTETMLGFELQHESNLIHLAALKKTGNKDGGTFNLGPIFL